MRDFRAALQHGLHTTLGEHTPKKMHSNTMFAESGNGFFSSEQVEKVIALTENRAM